MSRSTVRALALCGALAATFAGIAVATDDGDRDGGVRQPATSVADETPDLRAGSAAQLADCRDWRQASQDERLRLIEDIRSQVSLQDTPTPIDELSDRRTGEVFDRNCNRSFAGGFRLYKIYARAVAFNSLGE